MILSHSYNFEKYIKDGCSMDFPQKVHNFGKRLITLEKGNSFGKRLINLKKFNELGK